MTITDTYTQAAQFLLGMLAVIRKDAGRLSHLSSKQKAAFATVNMLASHDEPDPVSLDGMLEVARAYGWEGME